MLICTGCGNFKSQCSCIDMIGQPVNNNQELDAQNLEFVTYHAGSENVLNMINRLRENIVEDNSNLPEKQIDNQELNIEPTEEEILNSAYRQLSNDLSDVGDFTDD